MKAMTRHLVLLSMLAAGCGASNEDDGDDTSPGAALACDAVGWCTSWESDKRPVTDAPAPKGGAIPDGLYRLERGSEDARAMLIKGRSILKVTSLYFNILGTWNVDEEPSKETFRYAFAFKGDTLYLHEDEFEDMPIEAWRKVDQLCEENASFNCKVSNCACAYVSDSSFKDKERCF